VDRHGWLTLLGRRLLPAAAVFALLAASLKLAEQAAGGSGGFADAYRWVLGAAVLALVVLLALIGQRLWRLRRDLARDAPGARLSRRLLLTLVLLAVPPVVVVYGFALRFINATVDSWFDVNLERALDDALEVGRIVIDEHLRKDEAGSVELADELISVFDASLQSTLDREIDTLGAIQLSVFDADRRVLALASSDPRFLEPLFPDSSTLIRVAGEGRFAAAEPLGETLLIRVVVPVGAATVGGKRRLLQGLFPLPERLQPLVSDIENASFDFQRLKYLRGSLKLTFGLILTFVLSLSVLFAVLAAFGVSRRLLAPVGRLIHATRAVGAGRFDTPLPVGSNDELGQLMNAFSQMTRELELAGTRARRSAQEIETQRAWLGAVLERLSAGVLGFDHLGVLRVANRAAEAIFGIPLGSYGGHTLADVRRERPELAAIVDPLARHMREGLREWREEVVVDASDGRRVLMLRGAALPGEGGFVAVFDDLTVLNSAQRDAAWGEVARRLAHEVKNPLTPIQLSAERLRRRFIGRLPTDDSELLDRATSTIISQVEALKSMVNAFGDYARPPQLTTRPVALHALIGEVLDLYANDQRLSLTRQFVEGDPMVKVDAVRLRQAMHNLLKNALEAIGDQRRPQIVVSSRIVRIGDSTWVDISIADNGPGLPEAFGDRWFEPYTSSKARGTGLGLAVVKKIAEEHGGSVRANAREGGGAEFTLRLPLESP
jgi:nitrogen fixation/metabolism regulation signal transduction histidine kinase